MTPEDLIDDRRAARADLLARLNPRAVRRWLLAAEYQALRETRRATPRTELQP